MYRKNSITNSSYFPYVWPHCARCVSTARADFTSTTLLSLQNLNRLYQRDAVLNGPFMRDNSWSGWSTSNADCVYNIDDGVICAGDCSGHMPVVFGGGENIGDWWIDIGYCAQCIPFGAVSMSVDGNVVRISVSIGTLGSPTGDTTARTLGSLVPPQ